MWNFLIFGSSEALGSLIVGVFFSEIGGWLVDVASLKLEMGSKVA